MARSISLVLALGVLVACRGSQMSATDFRAGIEPEIVESLCDHDRPADQLPSYYRTCFDVDEAQCSEVMRRDVHACAERLVRGAVDEARGSALAVRIGACATADYELELDRTRIRSHSCDLARDVYAKDRASVNR